MGDEEEIQKVRYYSSILNPESDLRDGRIPEKDVSLSLTNIMSFISVNLAAIPPRGRIPSVGSPRRP
jgi:hypothetical protein